MEKLKEQALSGGNEAITQEMIDAKGKEADSASVEVNRIEEEIRKVAVGLETPDDKAARAKLEEMLPGYRLALAEERRLDDEWLELVGGSSH
jgi:hypothetical protein